MKKILASLLLASTASLSQAFVLVEDFQTASWENGWLGTNSNIENFNIQYSAPHRLWLTDGDSNTIQNGGDNSVDIVFDSAFGSTLQSLSIDIAAYSDIDFIIYDTFSNILLNTAIAGDTFYNNYYVNSTTGIGGFSFKASHFNIEGWTQIDNVRVSDQPILASVPEPSTIALLGLGLIGLRASRRKTKNL